MPRINVDDDFWIHPRYRHLSRLVGDEDKAAGMCLRAWRIAQRYWADRKTIPSDVWEMEGLEPLIVVGLAERRDDGVYCRGSETHFEWYQKKVEAGRRGGLKSARARAEKFGTSLPKNARNTPKRNRSTASKPTEAPSEAATEARPNPLTLTLYDENTKDRSGSDVWEAYSGAYLARYRVPPIRNAKVNSMCAQLVKRLGGDAAIAVVRFYLTHNSAYYVQKAHGLGPCLADAEGLHTQWKNNTAITQASASHADKNSANHQAFKAVAARWAERKKGEADGKGD